MHRLSVVLFMLAFAAPANAETIRIPVGYQGQADAPTPRRGESKASVQERFGPADKEHPSVGKPPISRWDYPAFSVYFEDRHVINSVRHHQRNSLSTPESKP